MKRPPSFYQTRNFVELGGPQPEQDIVPEKSDRQSCSVFNFMYDVKIWGHKLIAIKSN